jgi:hypothetical protein
MGKDIYEALKKAESRFAFVSGEAKSFFVPERVSAQVESPSKVSWKELAVGDIVRVLKPQGSDLIGKVESLSTKEEILNSGLSAEAASVKFLSGDIRTVASANLEIVDI